MNEWFKKNSFPNLLVVIVLGLLLCWGAVGYGRSFYYKTRYDSTVSELGQLRAELSDANDRKSELEEVIGRTELVTAEAAEYIDRTDEILCESRTTLQEIRAQVQDLVMYCNRLTDYIMCIRNINTNNEIGE